ncbi:uncharacterized protein [Lolium perenne]|uniref:uncharacterized protein isoform X3 n=1 Tax=Lolium perenne TaxID=4522 RepID=UPI0021F5155B|nr:uncharacterized protein LOC127300955 isoform X3 [Lolium perenne]
MEGVGARLGRSSARYGPATTFTGPVRKWRKEWVPIAAATGSATSTAASSTGAGSRGNNLVLFKWTPLNGANGRGGGDEELTAPAEMATRRRRYVPVSVAEDQRQESAKSDDENKANDGEPSSTETEQSNGKTNIDDTFMDESQASDEVRDSGDNVGGTDLNLNFGPKDPNGDSECVTGLTKVTWDGIRNTSPCCSWLEGCSQGETHVAGIRNTAPL